MKIKEIILFSNNIQNQRQFYKTVLGFEMIEDTAKRISFKIGTSQLVFMYKEKIKASHVAFNIPYNAIYDALKWLGDKVEVLQFENKKVADFSSWKAKAIYFYDADNNIMEFIARERIDIESDEAFTPRLIISISEMAIATDNIETIYKDINKYYNR